MKVDIEDLLGRVALLIHRGAVEVEVEFMGNLTILGWRFPGEAADSVPLEVEGLWRFSGSSC